MEWKHDSLPYRFSDASEELQPETVRQLLRTSYWAADRPLDVIARSLRGSLCLGLYRDEAAETEREAEGRMEAGSGAEAGERAETAAQAGIGKRMGTVAGSGTGGRKEPVREAGVGERAGAAVDVDVETETHASAASGVQIGLVRIVTDYATFSWVCDVIVHPDHRGQGLGKWMMRLTTSHPLIRETSMVLGTRDAHGLYEPLGFVRREMMLRRPDAQHPPKS